MRQGTAFILFIAFALLSLSAACDGTEEGTADLTRHEKTLSAGPLVAYEGPEKPADSPWVLRSLNGRDAAAGSDITLLFPVKGELGVEGGCLGFSLYHDLEGDRLRTVKPGLQVGRLDCDKPEAVKRQAEEVLDITRELAGLRIAEGRLELRSASGEVAVFAHPPPPRVDPALVGTEWFLSKIGNDVPGTKITLEIGPDSVGGFSGCNQYGGAIDKMDGGTLTWSRGPSDGFASTLVGCPGPEIERLEEDYQRALSSAQSYAFDGERLEIMGDGGGPTLAFSRKPDWKTNPAALADTRWVLRSINGERPAEGSTPTVSFESEKGVTWYDGCQNFSGHYHVTENDLTVPEYGVVGGDCMKPEAFEDTDGTCVVACFAPEGDYRLKEGLLEIRSETGETTAVLEPLARGGEPEQKGTPWALRGFVEGGKTTPVSGKAGITLTFDEGTLRRTGTIFGSTGCNAYSVAYEHPIARNGPDRLNLAEPVVTKRGCSGSRGLLEQRFLRTLRQVEYYPAIYAEGTMSLRTADGRKLVFGAPD